MNLRYRSIFRKISRLGLEMKYILILNAMFINSELVAIEIDFEVKAEDKLYKSEAAVRFTRVQTRSEK